MTSDEEDETYLTSEEEVAQVEEVESDQGQHEPDDDYYEEDQYEEDEYEYEEQ